MSHSNFLPLDHSAAHPGVARFEDAVDKLHAARKSVSGSRGLATLLLAAGVSALLVVANEVIDTVHEGHLFAAWMGLWIVAFAAIALFAAPTRSAARSISTWYAAWQEQRQAAASDARLWDAALHDARIMADISAAMTRHAVMEAQNVPDAPASAALDHYSAEAARSFNVDDEITSARLRRSRALAW